MHAQTTKRSSAGRRCRLVLFTAIAAIAGVENAAALQDAGERAASITPDPAVQSALLDLYSNADPSAFDGLADRQLKGGDGDVRTQVSQLLWFAASRPQEARAKAFVGRVLARLPASSEIVAAALAPHLDDRDAAIRAMAADLLRGFEDRSAARPPDFSAYRAIIESEVRAGRQPQTSLVGLMYESDPGVALQTMVRACGLREPDEIKSILWSEHVVAELFWKRRYGFVAPMSVDVAAVKELEALSRHARWWVRLYAAEILCTNPELGGPEMVKRLQQDADARVRATFESSADAVQRPPLDK